MEGFTPLTIEIPCAIIIGYLLGSISFAVVVSRLVKGIDIRKVGTGNPGAANVLRQIGKPAGITVWILDTAKGAAAMALADHILGVPPFWVAMAGTAAVCGHCWSVFIKFQGGKGAATSGGVLFYLVPRLFPISLAIYFALQRWAPRSPKAIAGAVVFFLVLMWLIYRSEIPWLLPAILILVGVGGIINRDTIREIRAKQRE